MIRVLSVFGTRPEAIKMAPVIRELGRYPNQIENVLCSTGQHREMLDQVLSIFGITPDVDLDLMEPGQTPTQVASRVLSALEPVLKRYQPDWMLVQGDTTTVMAAAITAHYARIRVGHVEAGLRTGDRWQPFPEEMNRIITDHASDLCFAPTEGARQNLLREGIDNGLIRVTGNTVVDALMEILALPWQPSPYLEDILSSGADLILVTAHRRESFGAPLRCICEAIREIALCSNNGVRIVYPVHPNPNVAITVNEALGQVSNITLIPPVDYVTLVNLMKRSRLILTDSGGIQEEAPTLGVPVLVLRNSTERPEAVEAGAALVVGTEARTIVKETFRLLDDHVAYTSMARAGNPYGDGHASERIVATLLES
jgi:UDP-N-acetylglucosamine 2-epimerase (non-hydrolysing)